MTIDIASTGRDIEAVVVAKKNTQYLKLLQYEGSNAVSPMNCDNNNNNNSADCDT